jgi:hypothetical protein
MNAMSVHVVKGEVQNDGEKYNICVEQKTAKLIDWLAI